MYLGQCARCARDVGYVRSDTGAAVTIERAVITGREVSDGKSGRACITDTGRWVRLVAVADEPAIQQVRAYAPHDCPGERGGRA